MAPSRPARWIALYAFATWLIAGCATQPLVTVDAQPANHAWWLRTTFHPRGDSLRGIPVRALRDGWCAIDELAPRHFEPIVQLQGGGGGDAARYSVPGPRVDDRPTLLVLAVFRECVGGTGTAMVLLDDDGRGPTRAISVDVLASPAGYAMLDAASPERVHVVFCQECDVLDEYDWDAGARRFVLRPMPEEEP